MLVALSFFLWGSTAFAASITTTPTSHNRFTFRHACVSAPLGQARCAAMVAQLVQSARDLAVKPDANSPGGNPPYGPANLHSAYNLPTTAPGTPTVAIIDAFNDPNAASDLATYRSQFGLPSCATASGCLRIVNQNGGTTLPSNNTGWAVERLLDLDMVSAICENCHILLVEASSATNNNLGTAVNTAVRLGAIAVSNSDGENEFSSESSPCSSFYQHNNVAVTAGSGDSGPGVSYPAVCSTVIGVGGTTLNSDGSETDWNTSSTEGAGGGCSSFITKPSWQSSSLTGCSRKAVSDVSAVADPNTGVVVFDSFNETGFLQVGGTSASSPIIAATFALAGNVASTTSPASLIWSTFTSGLFEVGGVRYSFQGGLGSPNGVSDF
jgi:subtilase family serine protease